TTNTDTGEAAGCLRPPSMMAAPWRSPHNAPSRSRLRSSPIRCASRAWPRNRPHCPPPHGSTRRSPIPTCSTLRPRRVQISNPRAYPTQGSPSDRRSWAFLCGRFPVKCSKTIRNPLPDQNPEHHTRLLSKLMTPGVPKSLTHSELVGARAIMTACPRAAYEFSQIQPSLLAAKSGGPQAATERGQRVVHARRHLLVVGPRQHVIGLRILQLLDRQAVLTVAYAWRPFRVFCLCVRRGAGWYPLGSAEDCQGARPAVSRIRKTSTRAAARS